MGDDSGCVRPRASRWLALRMLPAVGWTLLRLRRLHPRIDLDGLVAAATPDSAPLAGRQDHAHAAAWLARVLVPRLRWLFPQPCLYWVLAGYRFLRQADLPAVMHFGVRRASEDLGAHAWLTLEGDCYFDDAEAHGYVETLRVPDGCAE